MWIRDIEFSTVSSILSIEILNIGVQHILTIYVTCRVSYMEQELIALRGRLSSSSAFGCVRLANRFNLLCICSWFCLSSSCVLCTQILPVSPACPFLIASFSGLSILGCQFLRLVHSWLPVFPACQFLVASFSGLSILDCPSGFL